MKLTLLVLVFTSLTYALQEKLPDDPMIKVFAINTWPFRQATDAAFNVLLDRGSAVDAVVAGCTQCEIDQCDGTVGWGGSPDEDGHSTLDALVMDGAKHDMGAVIQLKEVREASQVARAVLDHTYHSILVGENATKFAINLGFKPQSLTSDKSLHIWETWRKDKCQPNFWKNMINSSEQCGPYEPEVSRSSPGSEHSWNDEKNHDTIGIIALDRRGKMAAGTSTNGATHKIPGRASDSAIPGAGAFVDNRVGGAVATGDGDIMMRFSPSFLTVELIRGGMDPLSATKESIQRIANRYPKFSGAIVAATKDGKYGAACHGFQQFTYSIRDVYTEHTRLVNITCTHKSDIIDI